MAGSGSALSLPSVTRLDMEVAIDLISTSDSSYPTESDAMRIRRRTRGSLMITVCLCASHGRLSPDAMHHPADPKPSSRSSFYDPEFRRREVASRAAPAVRHEREEGTRGSPRDSPRPPLEPTHPPASPFNLAHSPPALGKFPRQAPSVILDRGFGHWTPPYPGASLSRRLSRGCLTTVAS